jgi:hypothetical protein
MMRKQIGDENQKARLKAAAVLAQFKGANVKTLNQNEVKDVLLILLQLLALADKDGNIK